MKLNYDFEGYQPPRITEEKLLKTLQSRQLIKQALLLIIASLLTNISLALLAFAVAPFSLEAGIACLILLGISLADSGVIAVLFVKRLSTQYQSKSNWLKALGI